MHQCIFISTKSILDFFFLRISMCIMMILIRVSIFLELMEKMVCRKYYVEKIQWWVFFHDVGLCIIIYVFWFIQLRCVIQVVQNRNSKAIHHKYIWYTNVEQIATNIDWHFFLNWKCIIHIFVDFETPGHCIISIGKTN